MKTAVTEMFVEVINYLRSARHEIMQYFYRDKKVTIELKHYQAIVSSHSEEQASAITEWLQVLPARSRPAPPSCLVHQVLSLVHLFDSGFHRSKLRWWICCVQNKSCFL